PAPRWPPPSRRSPRKRASRRSLHPGPGTRPRTAGKRLLLVSSCEKGPPQRPLLYCCKEPLLRNDRFAVRLVLLLVVAGDERAPGLRLDRALRLPHDVELAVALHFADEHRLVQ